MGAQAERRAARAERGRNGSTVGISQWEPGEMKEGGKFCSACAGAQF